MKILHKIFQSFKGLDLRSSDILRSEEASTLLQNMTYRQTGAMSKRKGYQFACDDGTGGYGLSVYNNTNLSTGAVTEELITVDDNLHKLASHSFTIAYTAAANSNTYFTLFLDSDTSTFIFNLYDDGDIALSEDLGNGTEGSPVTISDLTSAIDALANFTCTAASGGTTEPAAFIPISSRTDVNTSAIVSFDILSQISTPTGLSNPFSTFYAQRTSSDFENATFAQLSDVIYIATGHDYLMKYDGNRVYRAGLPNHAALTVADASGGTAFGIGEVHSYLALYEYTDAKENVITGVPSAVKSHTQVANKDIDVTVTYLTTAGFNRNQVVVNGTQAGVTTITVDSDATALLKVGDYIYIQDGVSSSVVSRKVTAVTTTTVAISGAAVNVTDNDILSTVKISLYRTEDHSSTPTAPTLFYLAKEVVNNSAGTTLVYTDSLSDATLVGNAQYIEPIKEHGLPPSTKYVDEWRGQLLLSGSLTNVSTVYYSDIESPEYFPEAANSFIVDRKVTGVKALDNVFYVFKKQSVDGVTGDLSEDSFQVDKLSREGVGCIAHNTIKEVQGSLFFLSDRGVYSINNEGLIQIGAAIEPKFAINAPFDFKQASAFVWQADKKYILHMPVNTVDSSYSTDLTSEIYVYDYYREAWLEWANYNLMGGMVEKEGQIYKMSRDSLTTDKTRLHKILQSQTEYDYADHTEAISFAFKSPWITMGEPSIWKKFLRCKIHSYDTSVNDFENDSFTLQVATEHDFNTAREWSSVEFDFSGGSEGWGQGPWGVFPWGEIRLPQLKKKLAAKKVRSLRLIIENEVLYENVLISGYEFEVAMQYQPTLKE